MQATPRRNVQLTSKPDNIQNVPSHTEQPAKKEWQFSYFLQINKGNNKITELRTILQRESQNS
jgi:hypothetical protein